MGVPSDALGLQLLSRVPRYGRARHVYLGRLPRSPGQAAPQLAHAQLRRNDLRRKPRYSALSREITAGEWEEALAALEANGLENGFQQELSTANRYYRPDFTDRETPFRDVRDFTS